MMVMIDFEIRTTIDRPKDTVIQAYLDPKNITFWTKDLERFEILSGKPGQIGSKARLHYRQNGKPYEMEDELLECDAGSRYLSRVSGSFLEAHVETTFRSIEGATEVTMRWTGRGKGLLRIILPLNKRKMIKEARAELDHFKALVEAKGSSFSDR